MKYSEIAETIQHVYSNREHPTYKTRLSDDSETSFTPKDEVLDESDFNVSRPSRDVPNETHET